MSKEQYFSYIHNENQFNDGCH